LSVLFKLSFIWDRTTSWKN